MTAEHIQNIMQSSKRKPVYCYDYHTNVYVTQFDSIRLMSRELGVSPGKGASAALIRRRLASNQPFNCVLNGVSCTLLLSTTPLK